MINVAVLGYGTVGSGVVEVLEKNKEMITPRAGEELNVKYILDLRGNKGGNSEILNPFQDLVREKKLEGVLLIDSKVFSSGRFAVAKFITT